MAKLSSSNLTSNSDGSSATGGMGRLEVALPHWTAKVQIYDNLYQPVAREEMEVLRRPSEDAADIAATLKPGVYTVEVTLGKERDSKLVVVSPGYTTHVDEKQWAKGAVSASMPFVQADIESRGEVLPAEEASRTLTWIDGPGGESRLFLFLQTANPKRNPRFAEGLRLLDAHGNAITDFTVGVEHNEHNGWLAFNADLPPGYYILHRSRRGVPPRHQAIYLCAGWDTQCLLTAPRNYPSLSTMTLQMARRGRGIVRNDDAAIAADAVLDDMRWGSRSSVVVRERILDLMYAKIENPWLGILCGYALLRTRKARDSRYNDLMPAVIENIRDIRDHPDARALLLEAGVPTDTEFPFPPLLRDGLEIVHRHSMTRSGLIPLDSLTDLVLDSLLVDSPWVAWRHLEQYPKVVSSLESAWGTSPGDSNLSLEGMGTEDEQPVSDSPPAGDAMESWESARQTPAKSAPLYTRALVSSSSPRFPVYHMPSSEPVDESTGKGAERKKRARGATTGSEDARTEAAGYAAPATLATMRQAPVLWTVQEWTLKEKPEDIPYRLELDSTNQLAEVLNALSYEELSANTRLPLDRVMRGRAGLLALCASSLPSETLLTPDETAVFEVAVQRGDQRHKPAMPNAPTPSVTIEECVSQMLAAADRLRDAGAAESAKPVKSVRSESADKSAYGDRAGSLAARLRNLADALLLRADYILLTEPEGRLLYGNGAFLSLLAPPAAKSPPPATGQTEERELEEWRRRQQELRLENQRKWQVALFGLPTGPQPLEDPAGAPLGDHWHLRRTKIVDTASVTSQGRESAPVVAYLNVMHYADAPKLTLPEIEVFQKHIAGLILNASMFAYGSQAPSVYLKELEKIVATLEAVFA